MKSDKSRYQPALINVPPLFSWPLNPRHILKWLFIDLLWPWALLWFCVAALVWQFQLSDLKQMTQLQFDWIAGIWIRNAIILSVVAGGLHWWFYIHRGQADDTKFTPKWLAENDDQFLWGDQVKDNMFWSLVSGVTIWSAFEALTWWWYANGYMNYLTLAESPVYFVLMIWGVLFWSTFHFYFNHRLLHWKPLYDISHELHHRNSNTGPWTGISMHPIEHVIYFSVFLIAWVVPIHPVLIIALGLFQGVSPAVSHSGFDYLKIGKTLQIPTGDNFHNLHHRYFHINYGNSMTPIDYLFNSWHDGSEKGKAVLKQRMRAKV
ncbi:MAG: sterol desaturase family protein [Granulosicoccus sp.]|nr:sterol desaturase family protein [Granulosicoccus sp.]